MRAITLKAAVIAAAASPAALGGLPPLGGSMNHVLVGLGGSNTITLGVERAGPMGLVEGDGLFTGPAAVLNGSRFNAQYGWLVSGLWAPPAGASVYIEAVDVDPGLSFYAGRSFGPIGLMDPLLGTGSSDGMFAWDGVMLHNYAAVTAPGLYRATMRVFIGDAQRAPLPGYVAGEITLEWAWEAECAADLAAPFGTLDLADITLFVDAFVTGAPPADLSGTDRVFDLSDVVAFVGSFTMGCP